MPRVPAHARLVARVVALPQMGGSSNHIATYMLCGSHVHDLLSTLLLRAKPVGSPPPLLLSVPDSSEDPRLALRNGDSL